MGRSCGVTAVDGLRTGCGVSSEGGGLCARAAKRARNDCKTVPLCFYGWDRGFFAIIDEARQAACNGVGDRLAKMVGDRAYKLMEDKGMGWRLNRESLQPPGDTLEDEEYDSDEEGFIVSDERWRE